MNIDVTGFISTGFGAGISTGMGNGIGADGIDTTGGCWRADF